MITRKFTINNPTGLHARPASELCALCKKYQSKITIQCNGKSINPRSVISILTGDMSFGKTVNVEISGDDEITAMESMTRFFSELVE